VDGSSTGTRVPVEEPAIQTVTTIGLDIAKSVFQVHGVDAAGQVVIRTTVEASPSAGVLPEVASMPCWA